MDDAREIHDDFAAALLSGLLLLCLLSATLLRSSARVKQHVHETGIFILIGTAAGALVRACGSLEALQNVVRFDKNVFFIVLLPPIIFESGFNMDVATFGRNIWMILVLAIPGTLATASIFACAVWAGTAGAWSPVGALSMHAAVAYGSAYAATDPVTVLAIFSSCADAPRDLAAIIAGESLLNDAVAIVLYEQAEAAFASGATESGSLMLFSFIYKFTVMFAGSITAGAGAGVLGTLLFKHVMPTQEEEDDTERDSFPLHVALLGVYAYVVYAAAAAAGASGIVVLLSASIVLGVYGKQNIPPSTRASADAVVRVVAYTAESFIFAYLGLAIFSFKAEYDPWLIFLSIAAAFFARAVVVPVSYFLVFSLPAKMGLFSSNSNSVAAYSAVQQHPLLSCALLVGSGLRGAMAFALVSRVGGARNPPYHAAPYIMTSTLASSLLTVLLAGVCLKPALAYIENIKQHDIIPPCENLSTANPNPRFIQTLHERWLRPYLT